MVWWKLVLLRLTSFYLLRLNYSTQTYPVQAPLPVSSNAHALAFFSFMRAFAGVRALHLFTRSSHSPLLPLSRSGGSQSAVPFFKTNC